MEICKNKNAITLFALFLMISMVGSSVLIALPTAKSAIPAQTTNSATFAFLDVAPDPIGVGQACYLDMWLIEYHPLSGAFETPGTVWTGYTITVTAPDGTHQTLGPYEASPAATKDVEFTPTQVGNYSFFFSFPGQLVQDSAKSLNTYFLPSNTTATLVVQQDPIEYAPQTPLPTQYWTNPVDWQNQLWYQICGNSFGGIRTWEQTNSQFIGDVYNNATTAPETAHIMWTQPDGGAFGGQNGLTNQNDLSNYYTGKSYEQFYTPPVIINGVLYYNDPMGVAPAYGAQAVDLRTGKQLFYMNYSAGISGTNYRPLLSWGQVFSWHNPNEVGSVAYLWGSYGNKFTLYDATTGHWLLDIVNAQSGTMVMGPEGSILEYGLNKINDTYANLWMWNSTQCLGAVSFAANQWQYRPVQGGTTKQWSTGLQWNVTVPIFVRPGYSPSILGTSNGYMLVGDQSGTGTVTLTWLYESGYSMTTGENLWSANRTIGWTGQETTANAYMGTGFGVYVEHNKELNTYYGFSMATGEQLWGPVSGGNNPWDPYGRDATFDENYIYIQQIATILAINIHDGSVRWLFTAPPAGLEQASSTFLFEGLYDNALGGGLYFVGTSNSHGDQLFRGARLYALNTTTGDPVWTIGGMFAQGHAGGSAYADGYYTAVNAYDNQIYCFGKGPSQLTATAPNVGVSVGTPMTISGRIIDISAGTQQDLVKSNFPNGLPCVSDDSETQFMEAVYEQQTMPTNTTGVPVTISVIDSNGNYREIGTTTSDAWGNYALTWTPDISGDYAVIATFAGSGSNYGSSASTYFTASAVHPTTAPTQAPTQSAADMYFVPAIAGLFVLIIIVAIVLALLMLRKRP